MTMEVKTGEGSVAEIQFGNGLEKKLMAHCVPRSYAKILRRHEIMVFGSECPEGRPRANSEIEARGEGFSYHLHLGSGHATAYISEPIPSWQLACPLRQLLSWIVDRDGGVMLHAAGLYCNGKVALLAGASGSGKSTLAGAYMMGPGNHSDCFMGDDWIPVWKSSEGPWVGSALYGSLKLSDEMADRLGLIKELGVAHKRGKRIYGLRVSPVGGAPVGAVIVPTVAKEGLTVRRLTAFEAMEKIAPSTLLQSSGVSRAALRRIGELCREVPCYEMGVGSDFIERAPTMIRELCR
jgi:hypothetical protein